MSKCLGCGLPYTCKWYTPEKEAEIQKRLHARVVTFISKPKSHSISFTQIDGLHGVGETGVCELATLMEMLYIPHIDSEEIPEDIDIFSQADESSDKVKSYVKPLTADSIRASHHPTFDPPTATFPEVVNLTLDLSLDVDFEIKQRLSEFFEEKQKIVNFSNIRYKTLKKDYSDTCRFDLKTRFPNLKLLTVAEHTEQREGAQYSEGALLPFFLLPASVRVLRTTTNVLEHGDRFTDFLSNVPRLSDLLIDPITFSSRSATEEPGSQLQDGLSIREYNLQIADTDMSKLPGVRRLRLSDTTVVDRYDKRDRALNICEFLERANAPPTLRSIEFPFTTADFHRNLMFGSFQGLFFPLVQRNISSLVDNFRCEIPVNIKRVDVSSPCFNHKTPDKRTKELYIIILVEIFEQCYFEDMLHKIDSFFSKHSHRENVDEKMTRTLKRNLRLFLGGSQFGLPDSFADKVIHQIEERFLKVRHELSKASFFSQKASVQNVWSDPSHYKDVSYLNGAKIQRDKLQGMMGDFLEKSLRLKLYSAHHLMSDISKKTHSRLELTQPYNSIFDYCECEICKIVVTAGLKDNTERKLPFSISAIESMAEYDEIFFPSRSRRRRRSRAPSPPESRNASSIGGRKRIGSRKYIRRIRANKTRKA